MNCQKCGAAEEALRWDSDGEAWACMICGWRRYLPAPTAGAHPDCNMQFSVNCGSIVSERTHGRMRVRTWIEASKVTSLWHAHQERVAKEIVYLTHTDSFDYGYQNYEQVKQQNYAANGWQQRLVRDVRVTDPSSGSVG